MPHGKVFFLGIGSNIIAVVFYNCTVFFLSSSFSDSLYIIKLSISYIAFSKFPLTFVFSLKFYFSVLIESFVIIAEEVHVLWILLIRESKLRK